jgi:hypothetical protein
MDSIAKILLRRSRASDPAFGRGDGKGIEQPVVKGGPPIKRSARAPAMEIAVNKPARAKAKPAAAKAPATRAPAKRRG